MVKGNKTIDEDVEVSPEVATLMGKFRPVFGDDRSLRIGEKYAELRNLLTLEARAEKRRIEANRAAKEGKQAHKKIGQVESSLIFMLKSHLGL